MNNTNPCARPVEHSVRCPSEVPTFVASEILFVYDFDLLVDDLPGKPVDRDVHPVALLAFDDKGILETWFSSKVSLKVK